MKNSAAIIASCSGLALTQAERRLFSTTNPLGFILFARNCETPDQIRALVADLRESVGWECPILIDQEGGRVQRLKPPYWTQHKPANACTGDEACTIAHSIAQDLTALKIDVNCAPVMDLLYPETHDVIGDRAYSDDPCAVYETGLAVAQSYLDAGVLPINKHIPGHGRAISDSHLELPVIDTKLEELERTDFYPFRKFAAHELANYTWGMVAHIIYQALDPDLAASVSSTTMNYIRHEMGCDQFLLADDISMKALDGYGNLADRALKTLAAGCDATLYCAGILEEMEQILPGCPQLTAQSMDRYERSRQYIRRRPAA